MTLAAYSTSLNVNPSVAAGNGLKGQAVCNPGSGFVVATTANRAAGTVDLGGVALEDFTTGGQFRIVASGYVPADVVGTLTGTGEWVNVDAAGSLSRSASATSDTIGKYQSDGGVVVDLTLQAGGTSNATSIQGVSVTSASAGRSMILAGNGTALRSRQGIYNFRDWGPDETGATDVTALLLQAMTDIPNYSTLVIPTPSNFFKLGSTLNYYDDNAHGNHRGIHIVGEGSLSHNGGKYHFGIAKTRKQGTAATLTARTNGGSGNFNQTWTLDPGSGVLQADWASWVGRVFYPYFCALDDNNGEHIIIDVPADNTLRVYNRNAAANGSDTGILGTGCCWHIDEPLWDIRSRDTTFENLCFGVQSGSKVGSVIEFNHPPGAGAISVIRNRVIGCYIVNDTGNNVTSYVKDGIRVAQNLVPSSTSNFSYAGTNNVVSPNTGLKEFNAGNPPQVDTLLFELCQFTGCKRMGIAFYSSTAQSKENRIVECGFASSGTAASTYVGVGVPLDYKPSGWATSGAAHFDIYRCSFALIRDAWVQIGQYGSKQFVIQGSYCELGSRILNAYNTASQMPIALRDNTFATTSEFMHKSGTLILASGLGPVVVDGGYAHIGLDTLPISLFEVGAAPADKEVALAVRDWWLDCNTTKTVRFGKQTAGNRGPYKFAGTEFLGFKVGGGTQFDVGFSSTNFALACGYSVDMNEVHTYEVAQLFCGANWTGGRTQTAGCLARPSTDNSLLYVGTAGTRGNVEPVWPVIVGNTVVDGTVTWTCVGKLVSWGSADDCVLQVMSATMSSLTAGNIQVQAPASGTNANTILNFPTTVTGHSAQSRLGKDSAALMEWAISAGTAGRVRLKLDNVVLSTASPNQSRTVYNVDKVINGATTIGRTILEGVVGLSQTMGVQPKNFWCETSHVGGSGASFTWDATHGTPVFVAEEDAFFKAHAYPVGYSGGVPAAGYNEIVSIAYATSGVTITTKADPGAGVTVTWHVEMRR